jgi:hypothetical protein
MAVVTVILPNWYCMQCTCITWGSQLSKPIEIKISWLVETSFFELSRISWLSKCRFCELSRSRLLIEDYDENWDFRASCLHVRLKLLQIFWNFSTCPFLNCCKFFDCRDVCFWTAKTFSTYRIDYSKVYYLISTNSRDVSFWTVEIDSLYWEQQKNHDPNRFALWVIDLTWPLKILQCHWCIAIQRQIYPAYFI